MIIELHINRCAPRHWKLARNSPKLDANIPPKFKLSLWYLTSVREENETSFIRVWKPLSSSILKTLRESPKRTISTSGGLGPLQSLSWRTVEWRRITLQRCVLSCKNYIYRFWGNCCTNGQGGHLHRSSCRVKWLSSEINWDTRTSWPEHWKDYKGI